MPSRDPAHFLPSFVWHASPDGRIEYVNPWTCSYLGQTAEALLGMHWKAFVHPDDMASVIDSWRPMLEGATLEDVDVRIRRADGLFRWHTLHLLAARDNGEIVQVVGVGIDIHHCKHAWEMYEASERRLKAAFEAARLGAWEWNMETGVVRMTSQLAHIYDFVAGTDTATPDELWRRVPPDCQPKFHGELSKALSERQPFQVDYPIVVTDGSMRWLRMRGESEHAEGGALRRVYGVTFDITAQRERDERLSTSERRYRALVEATTALVWSADANGNNIVSESQWERFTGRTPESHAGSGWLDSVHHDDREEARRQWIQSVRMQTPHDFTFRMRRHDGVYRMVRAHAAPLYDDNRRLQEWFGTTTDVTEQYEAKAAIEERNLRLSAAMSAASMTIFSLDLATWSISWEGGPGSHTPRQGTTFSYEGALNYVHIDDRAGLDAFLKQLANGQETDFPFEFRLLLDGRERWMHGSALLHRSARGDPLQIVGSLIEITDRKRMELMLRETDRRKDEFLAMLAHELRNPLAPLRTAIALMQKTALAEPKVQELAGLMQRQVQHMTRIVDDLLEVSRITQGHITLKQEPIFVGSAVYGAVEAVADMVESRAQRLEVSVPAGMMWIYGDATRLSQIFVNILNNASKYTPEGGHITVGVQAEDDRVTITIHDNGTGISADLLPDIFELFSQGERTLDRSNGGLGIGLSLVKKLVEMHDGTISIESPGPGMGTTVTVRLPRLHQHERHPIHPPLATTPTIATPTQVAALRILIVDDNRDAADSLAMVCESETHTTRVAYTSHDAVSLAHDFLPNVALLDIGLPDIDGYELAKRLRPKGAKIPVLVAVTGYGQAEDRLRAQVAGFDYHFVKPVDIDDLLGLLSTLRQQD
ncbi:hybrid sensor histidine kinase/response regulator [Caballeronia sp.]|uniref:PAS domain-containing hybrid sensor histidine kinase/response regulator n=1 Tax=Caballeronia sp. TaxID=1931223 RepID=UPI003C67CEE3